MLSIRFVCFSLINRYQLFCICCWKVISMNSAGRAGRTTIAVALRYSFYMHKVTHKVKSFYSFTEFFSPLIFYRAEKTAFSCLLTLTYLTFRHISRRLF